MSDQADELLRLYGRHRIEDQIAYYGAKPTATSERCAGR